MICLDVQKKMHLAPFSSKDICRTVPLQLFKKNYKCGVVLWGLLTHQYPLSIKALNAKGHLLSSNLLDKIAI